VCSKCGKDVAELPQVKAITDEVKRNIALRTLIQVDHIDGNHDNDDIDNLQGLCLDCHAIKTTINEDYLNKG
jgi:5-methylcytosine-specific restriction endonuclease McrA